MILDSSSNRTFQFVLAMAILVGMSSLPFFNELVTQESGALKDWLASPETQDLLKDENGRVFGYSKFRVFLYYFLTDIYILIGAIGWYSVAKGKAYRNALVLLAISPAYHIFLILSMNRRSFLNEYDLKLWWTLVISAILFGLYCWFEIRKKKVLQATYTTFGGSPKKIVTPKVVLAWLAIIAVSTFIYFHDIITLRGVGIKDWVPVLGIENFLTTADGNVWGFGTYRVFILTLFVQLFAQIVWVGWWRDALYSLYKPFLMVPVGLSLYQIVMIVMESRDTFLNKPDIKLYLILAFGVFLGVLYYFKNKALPKRQTSITSVVPQNKNHVNQEMK